MFGSKSRRIEQLERIKENYAEDIRRYQAIMTKAFSMMEGCVDHPSYRAVRKPTAACDKCKELFILRQELNVSIDAANCGYIIRTGKRGKA